MDKVIPFIVLTGVALVGAEVSSAQDVLGHAIGGNDDLSIDSKDLKPLEIAASEGNAQAASKLFLYYEFYKDDHVEGMRWLTVAAENGDQISQCSLAKMLKQEPDDMAPHRAAFWMAKCLGK